MKKFAVLLTLCFSLVSGTTAPQITVEKTANPSRVFEPGGWVTFTVRVNNLGQEPVTFTSLVDDIHGDLDGRGTCSVPVILSRGWAYVCSFSAEVTGEPRTETDTVTATAEDEEGNITQVSDSATVVINDPLPRAGISKTADPTSVPEPGGWVTFTVRVSNYSIETLTITSLVDDIHGDLNGRGTCSVPQTIESSTTYECSFSTEVTGNAGDSETDIVTATVTDDEGNVVERSDDATVALTPAATTTAKSYLPLIRRNQTGPIPTPTPTPTPVVVDLNKISHIELRGDYVYLLWLARELPRQSKFSGVTLTVLDVSDAIHPTRVGEVVIGGSSAVLRAPIEFAASEDYVYVAGGDNMHIVDVSDPASPIEVGLIEPSKGFFEKLTIVHDSHIFAHWQFPTGATYCDPISGRCETFPYTERGIDIVDASIPSSPQRLGPWPDDVRLRCTMFGIGNYLLGKAPETGNLRVLDVSDWTHPRVVYETEYLGPCNGAVYSDWAYIFGSQPTVLVYDISDLEAVHAEDSFNVPGTWVGGIQFGDYRAYISSRTFVWDYGRFIDSIWIYDLSNPLIPGALGLYRVPGWSPDTLSVNLWREEFATTGNYLYTVEGDFFRILDVADPANIVDVGRYELE